LRATPSGRPTEAGGQAQRTAATPDPSFKTVHARIKEDPFPSQNVLAGWPGSAHDMRILNDTWTKYAH
jgi:hypothetical protein